jgi:hypothetical protein
MIYLASPYTHPDPAVMEARFLAACTAAGKLMQQGFVVFSPIAHTHPIAVHCELPRGWEFWKRFDEEFVCNSKKLIVLMLDGYAESKGVAAEVEIACRHGIPVEYKTPEELGYDPARAVDVHIP